MGVQATMTIGEKKGAVVATIASAAATYPAANQVRVVSILAAGNTNREADIQRAVIACINYARDNNLYSSAVSVSIVTKLEDQKQVVRQESVVANVVTGDVGILIVGSIRTLGPQHTTDEAHKQLLDWMRENKRLAA